jgi:transcriptional regulator of arginine metabolism
VSPANPVSPVTKTARQAQITAILASTAVRSQDELSELLAQNGVRVTQATLSRDLDELGAVRLRGPDGGLVYALPGEPGGPGSRPGGLAGVLAGSGEPRRPRPGVPTGVRGGLGPLAGRGPGGAGRVAGPARGGGGVPDREPPSRLARIAADFLLSAEPSANLVVLRTPAGAAQLVASAIDHAAWPSILGTVAGDDTVLVISREPGGGADVARALLRIAERRG